MALLRRTSFLTTFYGLYFSAVIIAHILQITIFHMLDLCGQLSCTVFIEPLLYFSRHQQSFNLLLPITHVCRPYIPFYSEYKSWPQAGFDPPEQSDTSYEADALPPSHHGWILLNCLFPCTKNNSNFMEGATNLIVLSPLNTLWYHTKFIRIKSGLLQWSSLLLFRLDLLRVNS